MSIHFNSRSNRNYYGFLKAMTLVDMQCMPESALDGMEAAVSELYQQIDFDDVMPGEIEYLWGMEQDFHVCVEKRRREIEEEKEAMTFFPS